MQVSDGASPEGDAKNGETANLAFSRFQRVTVKPRFLPNTLSSVDSFRRAFARAYRATPGEYRENAPRLASA